MNELTLFKNSEIKKPDIQDYTPEYSLRLNKSKRIKKVKILTSKNASNYIRNFYKDDLEIYESFFMVLLNRANITIGWVKISQGGISGTVADNKLIAYYAIKGLASSIILAHNHPSGNTTASEADKALTKKVKAGLNLLDVSVLDHIILTADSYYSFGDDGLL